MHKRGRDAFRPAPLQAFPRALPTSWKRCIAEGYACEREDQGDNFRLGSLRYGANIKTSVPKAMEKDDPMRSNGRLGRKALFSLAAMTTR